MTDFVPGSASEATSEIELTLSCRYVFFYYYITYGYFELPNIKINLNLNYIHSIIGYILYLSLAILFPTFIHKAVFNVKTFLIKSHCLKVSF